MDNTTIRSDMLDIAGLIAREKGLDKEDVIQALEAAIQKAAGSRYGMEFDIRATINRDSGAIELARYTEIMSSEDDVENEMTQIPLELAAVSHPNLNVGEFIIEELPPLEFGRIAAQTAKQVIVQKVREAERDKHYENFKDRIGDIVSATVKRADYGSVTLDLGDAEAVMRREEIIPRQHLRRGDRVRVYVYEVKKEQRGPQIFVSRTHPSFLVELFRAEVPEIQEGLIEIVSVARDPGSRSKICVKANEMGLDPVGSCVGLRGSRVQAVVGELLGEKIDIIEHTENVSVLVSRALQPATVVSVRHDTVSDKVEVVVADDQLSLAIGRRGQNVRLASQMLRMDLDIITESDSKERREAEFKVRSASFIDGLGVDELTARLLVMEGFVSVDEIAAIPTEELQEIEGIDSDLAVTLQEKANAHLEKESKNIEKAITEMGIKADLIEFLGMSTAVVNLGKNDVKSLEDLADLASDELQEILADLGITEEEAANIILQARQDAGWFDDIEEA